MDVFLNFLEMLDTLPVEAVCRAAEKEKEMIENDVACHRQFPVRD